MSRTSDGHSSRAMSTWEKNLLGIRISQVHLLLPGLLAAGCLAWASIWLSSYVGCVIMGFAKTPISAESHGIAAGFELMGSFEDAGDNWSILPGVYMPLGTQDITFKTGLELGKSDGADALRANATLMYRF